MAENATANARVNDVSNELRDAADAKILKVTRMIDLLPRRGEADLLLEPVRHRLATLRPPRPVTWVRLLFTPFDPLLVPAAGWRPGDLSVPRSLLGPLSSLLQDCVPAAMLNLASSLGADHAALTRAAAPLWAAVAARLADLAIPQSWSSPEWQKQHGLTPSLIVPLLPALRLVLSRAVELRTLPPHTSPSYEPILAGLLLEAAQIGPLAWGLMLTLLLEDGPPDQISRIATGVARGSRLPTDLHAVLDKANTDTLDRMETLILEPVAKDLAAAGLSNRLALSRRIQSFRKLEHRPIEEQRRVIKLRHSLAGANRQLFEKTLQAWLPGRSESTAVAPAAAGTLDGDAVRALETLARRLREFALAAAKLDDGDDYDRLLADAALRYTGPGSGLTKVDQLRLIELLIGSERALQTLGRA